MQDAERGEDRLVLAVFRHQADAERDGVGRRGRRDRLAVERDGAGGDAVGAEDGAGELGAAGADKAGDAEDLAGLEIEVDAFEHDGVRRFGIAHRAQAAHRKPDVAGDVALRRPGVELGSGAADHLLDDLRQSGSARPVAVEMAGKPAVAQHRHAVADRGGLLQPVGDEHDRDAVLAQPVHDRQQPLHLGLGQRRGRLVHDDERGFPATARGRSRPAAARRPTAPRPASAGRWSARRGR